MTPNERIDAAIIDPIFLARFDAQREESREHFYNDIPCRDWTGAIMAHGYGTTNHGSSSGTLYVHRIAWIRERGPIPDGLQIRHLCNRRCCTEVRHMTVGTHAENQHDKAVSGRARNGHTGALPDTAHPRTGWRRVV